MRKLRTLLELKTSVPQSSCSPWRGHVLVKISAVEFAKPWISFGSEPAPNPLITPIPA